MSRLSNQELSCPKCGNSQEVTVWDSLNISLDSNLKDRLFSGEINVFRCNTCDCEAFINRPLLYHDKDREYCVQYYPPEILNDDNFYKIFTERGKFVVEGIPDGHYLLEPHLVFNVNEMLIYIEFRDKLFEINKSI
jgi:hypothetical protein